MAISEFKRRSNLDDASIRMADEALSPVMLLVSRYDQHDIETCKEISLVALVRRLLQHYLQVEALFSQYALQVLRPNARSWCCSVGKRDAAR